MDTQSYAVLFMRAQRGPINLQPVRIGQLMTIADTHDLFPSTKFLIIVQPRGESPELQEEAERLGRDLLRYLRSEIRIPRGVPVLGPRILPCKLKQEQLRRYSRRVDNAQVGEPTDREPRVKLWVFRTDC